MANDTYMNSCQWREARMESIPCMESAQTPGSWELAVTGSSSTPADIRRAEYPYCERQQALEKIPKASKSLTVTEISTARIQVSSDEPLVAQPHSPDDFLGRFPVQESMLQNDICVRTDSPIAATSVTQQQGEGQRLHNEDSGDQCQRQDHLEDQLGMERALLDNGQWFSKMEEKGDTCDHDVRLDDKTMEEAQHSDDTQPLTQACNAQDKIEGLAPSSHYSDLKGISPQAGITNTSPDPPLPLGLAAPGGGRPASKTHRGVVRKPVDQSHGSPPLKLESSLKRGHESSRNNEHPASKLSLQPSPDPPLLLGPAAPRVGRPALKTHRGVVRKPVDQSLGSPPLKRKSSLKRGWESSRDNDNPAPKLWFPVASSSQHEPRLHALPVPSSSLPLPPSSLPVQPATSDTLADSNASCAVSKPDSDTDMSGTCGTMIEPNELLELVTLLEKRDFFNYKPVRELLQPVVDQVMEITQGCTDPPHPSQVQIVMQNQEQGQLDDHGEEGNLPNFHKILADP